MVCRPQSGDGFKLARAGKQSWEEIDTPHLIKVKANEYADGVMLFFEYLFDQLIETVTLHCFALRYFILHCYVFAWLSYLVLPYSPYLPVSPSLDVLHLDLRGNPINWAT